MKVYLDFLPEYTPAHRSRISYAFRLFCAIYGHEPLLGYEQAQSADVWIQYASSTASAAVVPILRLSSLYRPRSPEEPAPPPRAFVRDGEATVLFYLPLPDQQPDWLAEIFEWVSCADEYSTKTRDRVGRIPFEATYAGRHHLDIRVPYAAIAMRILQRALCRLVPRAATEPQSPVESARHFIVPTHDVDYLPVSRLNGIHRLAKNAAISSLSSKSPALGIRQAKMALGMAIGGPDPLDQISTLAQEEVRRGVTASYYFIVRHRHRRDANYTIDRPGLRDLMGRIEALGMEVGVHGSYTSLDESNGLADEFHCLREAGFQPEGGRQHWLRFTLDRLIPALECAGARYDTSLGWSDRIGFRAGACFPFPPYNFEKERPTTFLELPMAIMDQSLQEGLGTEADAFNEVAGLLSASRRYGWGGISLLWHPTAFGGAWLSSEVGDIFWRAVDERTEWHDAWLSATALVRAVRQRYVDCGLLPGEQEWAPTAVLAEQLNHAELVRA